MERKNKQIARQNSVIDKHRAPSMFSNVDWAERGKLYYVWREVITINTFAFSSKWERPFSKPIYVWKIKRKEDFWNLDLLPPKKAHCLSIVCVGCGEGGWGQVANCRGWSRKYCSVSLWKYWASICGNIFVVFLWKYWGSGLLSIGICIAFLFP